MRRVLFWGAAGLGGLLLLCGIGLFALMSFYRPFTIPSGSMKPTLLPGDYLLANEAVYLRSDPQRGDVAVFWHPTTRFVHIFRIIGIPGDDVELRDGQVHVNGAPLAQVPNGIYSEPFQPQGSAGHRPRCSQRSGEDGTVCEKDLFFEVLPSGHRYQTLSINAESPGDTAGPFRVPPDSYFLLGDNRDNANDSRFAAAQAGPGMVPRANIFARADWVVFSSRSRNTWSVPSWRGDRFWVAVQ